ncbi:MAG: hypothetical protein A2X47_10000 [Lentisphaerae bacterium GWF2_38_69]|nr:MAG: hypothetical protein A2X47_10000 [Lentisphaerae bacterium GWF2_38_69]
MFTFLSHNEIPWNNNTAERAIRHLAIQRKISGAFGNDLTPSYLRLLSIAQTCKFNDKSFLEFLLSKELNLTEWKSKRLKYKTVLKVRKSFTNKIKLNSEC